MSEAGSPARARAGVVELRPYLEGEESVDEGSVWDEYGERDAPRLTDLGRMVVTEDGRPVGSVSWHSVYYGPNLGSRSYNIGIGLAVAARGRGIGGIAQRMLAEHLFATTQVERVEAGTDVDNIAEQRSLEKAGFVREGVLRSAQLRVDGLHDMATYSLLRTDLARDRD
jgi:RimJ/RimL family protein N-acetyltransferase